MRWWMLGLLAPIISLSCGESSKSGGPDDNAGATSGGASGSAGRTGGGSGGASGTAGTAGAAGIGGGGTSGTSGGSAGSSATGGVGGAGSGGTAGDGGAGAAEGGAPGDTGAAGEAGDSGDDVLHAVSIDAGGDHSCALLDTGGVLCWGSNADGQVGDGSPSRMTDVVQLSAGSFHTCAVQASGNVKCWGQDLFGALGNGLDNLDDKASPVDVIDLVDAIAVTAGGAHTCALVRGGTAKCWGDDWEGQLGNGSDGEMGHESPVDVENLTNAIAITAGTNHTCAIIEGGTVRCWGLDLGGQLGNGATEGIVRSPMDVPGVDEVVALEAGAWHTCALRANGAVLCWGTDNYGQLGDGDDDEVDEPSPVAVTTVTGATSIAVGAVHTCATLSGGTVQCWGGDEYGQIGDGDDGQANQMSAADVLGLADAVTVTVGFDHTCALGETGVVLCWGRDVDGQVGNGGVGQVDKLAPVVVQGF